MAVDVECRQISSGRLLHRFLLVRRKLRLELLGDGFGNLALDGEDISEVAIVGLRPEMRIIASVDQLRTDPNLVGCPLHSALEQMRDTQLPPDLAQIASDSALVLHNAR